MFFIYLHPMIPIQTFINYFWFLCFLFFFFIKEILVSLYILYIYVHRLSCTYNASDLLFRVCDQFYMYIRVSVFFFIPRSIFKNFSSIRLNILYNLYTYNITVLFFFFFYSQSLHRYRNWFFFFIYSWNVCLCVSKYCISFVMRHQRVQQKRKHDFAWAVQKSYYFEFDSFPSTFHSSRNILYANNI